MAIALIITDRDVADLQSRVKSLLDDAVPVWIYPDIPDPTVVSMAVVWKHPTGVLNTFPNLQLVSSFGAGVEHILQDPQLPAGIAITRIVDDSLSVSMRNYVLMAVLNIQRQFRQLQRNQQAGKWKKPQVVELPLRIGVLGLGTLGGRIAADLSGLGFTVLGYSRRPKDLPGVNTYSEQDEPLPAFVRRINLLVNVLPHTFATDCILNSSVLSELPKGSFLINVGRGSQLVEADLLRAMREDHIAEAWLDVFSTEPLPADHPFWQHDQIVITPHIASVTNQLEAATIIADNYLRMKSGRSLRFRVDRKAGY